MSSSNAIVKFDDLNMIVEEELEDPPPKYWALALMILGFVLIIIGIALIIFFSKKCRKVTTP